MMGKATFCHDSVKLSNGHACIVKYRPCINIYESEFCVNREGNYVNQFMQKRKKIYA